MTKYLSLLLILALVGCGKKYHNTYVTGGSTAPAAVAAYFPTYSPTVHYCGNEDFGGNFALGDIHGQDGWFSDPSGGFNQAVSNAAACSGSSSWLLNSTVASNAFGNQPQSPQLPKTAGESTVSNGGGDTFEASMFIRTKSTTADNSAFTMSFSPGPVVLSNQTNSGVDRHNYLRFENATDANGGFKMYGLDGVLVSLKGVAKNLTRGDWIHVRMIAYNPDGPKNDITAVYVNDVLVAIYGSWEEYRASLPASTIAMDHVLFRMQVATPGSEGFYIDNFEQKSYNMASSNTILQQYKTGFEQ